MQLSSKLILTIFLLTRGSSVFADTEGVLRIAAEHDVWVGYNIHPVWFVLFMAVMMWAVAIGVGLFYHRVLTHRVFKPNRFLAYFFVTVAAPAGTPIQWVGNHRSHHQVSDTDRDPHSPTDKGFWVAHAGWYLGTENILICMLYSFAGPLRMVFDAFWRPRTNQEYVHKAKDIAADPYYAWISKPGPYAFVVLGHVLSVWIFVYCLWGAWALGFLYLVQLSFFIIGDTVNSIMHMWGDSPFESGDKSRNVPFMHILTSGESFHNAHHAIPSAVNLGLLPGQFDLNYFWALMFEKMGLATELRRPSKALVLSKLKDDQYREYIERTYRENL